MKDGDDSGRGPLVAMGKGSCSTCILNEKAGFAEGLDIGDERKREAYKSDNYPSCKSLTT